MIKVTVKESSVSEKAGHEAKLVVKEHKDAEKAHVNNGVLSLYPESTTSFNDFGQMIAGYEAGSWVGFEKISVN